MGKAVGVGSVEGAGGDVSSEGEGISGSAEGAGGADIEEGTGVFALVEVVIVNVWM